MCWHEWSPWTSTNLVTCDFLARSMPSISATPKSPKSMHQIFMLESGSSGRTSSMRLISVPPSTSMWNHAHLSIEPGSTA